MPEGMPRCEPDDSNKQQASGSRLTRLPSFSRPGPLRPCSRQAHEGVHPYTWESRVSKITKRRAPLVMHSTRDDNERNCSRVSESRELQATPAFANRPVALPSVFLQQSVRTETGLAHMSCARHTGLDRIPTRAIVVNTFTQPKVRCCWKLDGGRTAVSMTGWQGVPLAWAA